MSNEYRRFREASKQLCVYLEESTNPLLGPEFTRLLQNFLDARSTMLAARTARASELTNYIAIHTNPLHGPEFTKLLRGLIQGIGIPTGKAETEPA